MESLEEFLTKIQDKFLKFTGEILKGIIREINEGIQKKKSPKISQKIPLLKLINSNEECIKNR